MKITTKKEEEGNYFKIHLKIDPLKKKKEEIITELVLYIVKKKLKFDVFFVYNTDDYMLTKLTQI